MENNIEEMVQTTLPKKRGRKPSTEKSKENTLTTTISKENTPEIEEEVKIIEDTAENTAVTIEKEQEKPKKATKAKREEKEEPTPEVKIEIKQNLLTDYQLTCLKRCLGWNDNNPPRVPNHSPKGDDRWVLYSYRNRYYTNPKPDLEDMVIKGIFEKGSFGENGVLHNGYRATPEGINFLSEAANIRIVEVRKKENGNVYEPVYYGTQNFKKEQR